MINSRVPVVFNAYWEEFKHHAEDTNKARHADWERRLAERVEELNKKLWFKIFGFAEFKAIGDVKFYEEIPITIEAYMDYCSERRYKI